MDDSRLDELEQYLKTARILDVAHFPQHGAHRSYRLILEGGVGVLAKPADTIGEGAIVCRREAAAWVLARDFGWPDLLAATVLRTIPSPDSGDEVETSLQVLWPDVHPDAETTRFGDGDLWRAGCFDAVVGHADRGGHNWLAVPGSSPEPGLKLVDHGYGFPEDVSPPNSTFYELRKGQALPEEIQEALELLRENLRRPVLEELLPTPAVEAVMSRAETLLSSSTLEIPTP